MPGPSHSMSVGTVGFVCGSSSSPRSSSSAVVLLSTDARRGSPGTSSPSSRPLSGEIMGEPGVWTSSSMGSGRRGGRTYCGGGTKYSRSWGKRGSDSEGGRGGSRGADLASELGAEGVGTSTGCGCDWGCGDGEGFSDEGALLDLLEAPSRPWR